MERRLWQTLQRVRGWHAFARPDGPVSVLRASRRRPTTSLATTPKESVSTGLQCCADDKDWWSHECVAVVFGYARQVYQENHAPELVQEASGEIVRITFHDDEGFGCSRLRGHRPKCPSESHPCWKIGWVLCDRLPAYVSVRFDKVGEDYTGLHQPGVCHVEPTNDEWKLVYKPALCIHHPLAPADEHGRKVIQVSMVRHQIPLAPERIGTYQNQQGKTVRGPESEPLGHTISLRRPSYLHEGEYKQHLYMILGRARAFKWSLFHDFPMDEQGLPKWSWFETGPPKYILAFFNALQPLAELTLHNVELARQELRVFPLWRCRPALEHMNSESTDKMYVYNKEAWDKACSPSCPKRPQDGHLLAQAYTSTSKRV